MLIPSVKVVFEGPSKEYYTRLKTIVSSRLTGCARLVFSDFEGTVFYRDGRTVTALQESGTWMALGADMIAPLENKAVATAGTMAIYELTPAMVSLFEGRKIDTKVETDLGELVNAGMLVENLRNSASTCIMKVKGPVWTGYVFMVAGNIYGASYVSDKDRHYGDTAIAAITRAAGKAVSAIYFLEKRATTVTEAAVPPAEAPAKPAEAPAQAAPQIPVEPAKPVETPQPAQAEKTGVVRPAPAEAREAELRVTTTAAANLRHQSRMATLEALETRSIAWVDESVLRALKIKESDKVGLVLPGNRTERVTIARVDTVPGSTGFIILPEKLRKRLLLKPGNNIIVKP